MTHGCFHPVGILPKNRLKIPDEMFGSFIYSFYLYTHNQYSNTMEATETKTIGKYKIEIIPDDNPYNPRTDDMF